MGQITNATVQIAEGVGKLMRVIQRSIGGSTVYLQGVFTEDSPYDTFTAISAAVVAPAANDHVFQLMAGANKDVYLHRLVAWQLAAATAAAIDQYQLLRLTTAGTGGSAITPNPLDLTGNAVTATARGAVTASKGTEGAILDTQTAYFLQTIGATPGGVQTTKLLDFDYRASDTMKPRITRGAANGLALKALTTRAAASLVIVATFSERDH